VLAGRDSFDQNISSKPGTTLIIIIITTAITTTIINAGYIIADFIFQDIHSTFSI
jgi:hypothetical protein